MNCDHSDLAICMAFGHAPTATGASAVDIKTFYDCIRKHQQRALRRVRATTRRLRRRLESL